MGNLVVEVGGGAMKGVFCAGVLEAMLDMEIRNEIDAIYGFSAGAINAAMFLTENEGASRVYTDYLTEGFVHNDMA